MLYAEIRHICKQAAQTADAEFTPCYFNTYARNVWFCQYWANGQWNTF